MVEVDQVVSRRTKITLRPEGLQGLVHLMLSTSDTIVTAITSSEIAVVEKLLDNYY